MEKGRESCLKKKEKIEEEEVASLLMLERRVIFFDQIEVKFYYFSHDDTKKLERRVGKGVGGKEGRVSVRSLP